VPAFVNSSALLAGRSAHQLGGNFTCTTSGVSCRAERQDHAEQDGDAAVNSQNAGDARFISSSSLADGVRCWPDDGCRRGVAAWRLGQGRTSNVAARSWRSAGAASFPKRPCLVRSCQKLAVSHPDYDGVFGMTRRQAAARSISGSETTHGQCEAALSRPPESGALSERALLSHHHPPRRIGLTSNFQGAQLKEDKPVRVRRRDIWMT